MAEQFGRYRLDDLLGRGGMGEVYLAHDLEQKRDVALKILSAQLAGSSDFQRRFRRESELAARLNEPHIIPIHGYGEIDGRLYIDMRLVRGVDLGHLLREEGRLSPQRAVAIASQVASALDAAQAAGMVHRDVKPSNILVTRGEREDDDEFVYLIDFGITRALESAGQTSLTATGALIGTLAYMAPECFTGDPVDSRADVYALACTLYQSLTGRAPFDGDGVARLMYAHLNRVPPRPSSLAPGIPPALDAVVGRGLEKRPELRFGSPGDMAAAARAALRGTASRGTDLRGTGPSQPVRRAPDPGPTPVAASPTYVPAPPPAPPTSLPAAGRPRVAAPTVLPDRGSAHSGIPGRSPVRRAGWAVVAAVLAVALVTTVVVVIRQGTGATAGAGPVTAAGTFTLGTPGAPEMLDPFLAADGETFRATRQMFDTLVTTEPGGSGPAPGLATAWSSDASGTVWTFTLRQGVTFHDGTAFDAAAVCANFDRWHNTANGLAQAQALYFDDTFEGFAADGAESVFRSCEAPDPGTAVVRLNRAKGIFPVAFGLPSLAISSPTALDLHGADQLAQDGAGLRYSSYAVEHPTGTGPFRFESFDREQGVVTMVRNESYWGEPARVDRLVLRSVPDPAARRDALTAGAIDGYDLVPAADLQGLRDAGFEVLVRRPFNILYLGINTANNPALQDVRVRRAIALAVDRESLVRNLMPEGSVVATQFVPDTVDGHAADLQPIPYDPAQARQLLAEAGQPNLTVNFYHPTGVARPYMPDPAAIFGALAENLREVGITVAAVAQPWNGGYLDSVTVDGVHDLHLLGWTGDYNDAGNFVGTFFGRPDPEFGQNDPAMYDSISAAAGIPDEETRIAAYEQVNRDLMTTYLPAVPLSSSPTAMVVRSGITGLALSPLQAETYATVQLG